MLSLLKIKNLALIEDITWNIGKGLICVTGETGAGKSLALSALKIILGKKADKKDIRTGTEQCTIEAIFEVSNIKNLNDKLQYYDLPLSLDNQLIIKRTINRNEPNKQFINCSPITLNTLRDITKGIVDLHDPYDQQTLNFHERQLEMLDAYSKNKKNLEIYQTKFQKWTQNKQKLNLFLKENSSTEAEIEILKFQLKEIDEQNLEKINENKLHAEYKKSANLKQIKEISSKIINLINSENSNDKSISQQINTLYKDANVLNNIDKSFNPTFKKITEISSKINKLENEFSSYCNELNEDSQNTTMLEEKINKIEELKRKYGGDINQIISYKNNILKKITNWDDKEKILEELKDKENNSRQETIEEAKKISSIRNSCIPKMESEIINSLSELGLEKSQFNISISKIIDQNNPTPTGIDEINFYFSPNPGEPAKPINEIASSGEMSRILLAVKSSVASQENIPLLVFDEIDANIGGLVAHSVGEKMQKLSEFHQVISITHLPQVAVSANTHYVASKKIENNRTYAYIHEVKDEKKIDEITRMLGGENHNTKQSARTLAKNMLGLQ